MNNLVNFFKERSYLGIGVLAALILLWIFVGYVGYILLVAAVFYGTTVLYIRLFRAGKSLQKKVREQDPAALGKKLAKAGGELGSKALDAAEKLATHAAENLERAAESKLESLGKSLTGGGGSSAASREQAEEHHARRKAEELKYVYVCGKCGEVAVAENSWSMKKTKCSGDRGGHHDWCQVGTAGDMTSTCQYCGTVVHTRTYATTTRCHVGGHHNWR